MSRIIGPAARTFRNQLRSHFPSIDPPDLQPFDFAIVRYIWDDTEGRDLDTRTAIMLPTFESSAQDVGWNRLAAILGEGGYFMQWGGDNTTDSGAEAVLIDFKKIAQDFPDAQEISIRMRGFWYNERISGDMSIQFETYLGGTMEADGFDFVNVGGSIVQTINRDRNVVTHQASDIDGEELGTILYSTAEQTAQIQLP